MVHMHGMCDFSGRWAQPCQLFVGGEGWESVCFREIGWLFGAARGLEALDLGAEMRCGLYVI